MTKRILTLIIPDLLINDKTNFSLDDLPLPALKKILAKGTKQTLNYSNLETLLFALFGVSGQKLPVAAVTALAVDLPVINRYWLRADPVELKAGLSGLFLIGNSHLTLQKSELQILRENLNQLLQDYNICLHTPWERAWLLELTQQPKINVADINSVIGKEISGYLPRGKDQTLWRRLLTEIQMLLHQSPINEARENVGRPLINSVWFWGNGSLPATQKSPYKYVFSNDPIAIGLAKWSETDFSALINDWHKIKDFYFSETCNILVVNDLKNTEEENSVSNRDDYLLQLENDWFSPALSALKKRQLDKLILYPNYQSVFSFTRKNFWYWRLF